MTENHNGKLAVLEQRVQALESFASVVRSSRLGYQIRMLEADRQQRAIDNAHEYERELQRADAGSARQAAFERFVEKCLCLAEGAQTAGWALRWTYRNFVEREDLDTVLRLNDDELFEAVTNLQGVERTVVRAGPVNGRQHGYEGVEVIEEHRHEHDCLSRRSRGVKTELTAGEKAERQQRREYEAAIHPTPKSPPNAFREPTK